MVLGLRYCILNFADQQGKTLLNYTEKKKERL